MIARFISITPEQVHEIHDLILKTEMGLPGENAGYLEGALNRIATAQFYEGVDDLFELAAHYARAIGQGHCFNDANKRTGLVTCLTFLELHGVTVQKSADLEDAMVDLTTKVLPLTDFATLLFSLAEVGQPNDTAEG
ncbi:Death on curing family protein [Cupriavidus taiwanensis]|uniref:Death on curing family protein n=1 Tax=Cupriavidus taiwanensis TaxID=164546 RepID=A0A375EBM1_9BURK|nr:type II toxin-antitoxin system death-on-curing family toxin [Cupriavidus taiwanensis]SOZ62805.1 Death on curing family protein [Cupriavidus taiwanensis]SOZ63171.1 Death on curing family protein [Cupriavidus taiwanensis]SOZ74163.1 Death on curing family protein [Cupriavidus taiwanensis]